MTDAGGIAGDRLHSFVIIRRRAMSQEEREAEDWALDAYEHALAGWDGTPLGDVAARREAAE